MQQNYNITEKELLAAVVAIRKFQIYLSGAPFTLITDHYALRWINSLSTQDTSGRRGRWIEYLQQFDIDAKHKAGKSPEMSIADFLSRVTPSGDCQGDNGKIAAVRWNSSELVTTLFDFADFKHSQKNDLVLNEVVKWLKLDGDAEDTLKLEKLNAKQQDTLSQIMKNKDRLFTDSEGIIRLRFNGGRRSVAFPMGKTCRNRVVVPDEMKTRCLQLVHDGPLAGHMGENRTWLRLRNCFYWPKMRQDLKNYIASCDECGRNKQDTHQNKAPIQNTDIPISSMDHLQVDFLGPFAKATTHDYRYALQIQDVLSRYLQFIPCKDSTAVTAATAIIDNWLCVYTAFPTLITSDHGPHFIAEVFESMCRLTGIQHRMAAPGHARTMGQVERQNQLLNQVKSLCSNNLELWPKALSRIQYCHNTAPNATTKLPPALVGLGIMSSHPEVISTDEKDEGTGHYPSGDPKKKAEEALKQKEQVLLEAVKRAMENTSSAQDERNKKLNEGRSPEPYKVGQIVRYRLSNVEKNRQGGKKIAPRNSKKYVVTEVHRNLWTYHITPQDGIGRTKIRHFDQLITAMDRVEDPNLGEDSQNMGDDNMLEPQECDEINSDSEDSVTSFSSIEDMPVETRDEFDADESGDDNHSRSPLPPIQTPPTRRYPLRERDAPSRLQLDNNRNKQYSERVFPMGYFFEGDSDEDTD